jgi:hypothetical protein
MRRSREENKGRHGEKEDMTWVDVYAQCFGVCHLAEKRTNELWKMKDDLKMKETRQN